MTRAALRERACARCRRVLPLHGLYGLYAGQQSPRVWYCRSCRDAWLDREERRAVRLEGAALRGLCRVAGCLAPASVRCRGYCRACYARGRKTGEIRPLGPGERGG